MSRNVPPGVGSAVRDGVHESLILKQLPERFRQFILSEAPIPLDLVGIRQAINVLGEDKAFEAMKEWCARECLRAWGPDHPQAKKG